MPARTKHLISTIQSLPISRGSARSLLAEYLPQIQKQGPLLIAGLGNPGEKYAQNRHNIGFIIIDRLCECLELEMRDTSRFHAHIATLAPHIHIAKPQTFMNHSGSSIAAITSFYKINQLCIAHDELDLPLSTIRYKLGGSSGGHNGLKSIDSALHRQDYVRLRFGIKEAPAQDQAQIPKHKQVIDFVLGDFTLPHTTLMELVDKSVRGLLFFIITRDFAATQSHFSHSTKSQSAASKHSSPRSQAHAIATRATKSALFFPLDSSPNVKNVESTFDNPTAKTQKVDSSDTPIFATAKNMDCHATATQCLAMTENNAANENAVSLEKVDSSDEAKNLTNSAQDSRENAQNIETPQNEKTKSVFDKNLVGIDENAELQKVDSSDEVQNLTNSQAAGFCDDFVGCQGVGEGIYLSGNEQAHAADSRKSAQKPTPKPNKAESTTTAPTQSPNYAH
ncbi:aminoacyl-tRNA hydrolase [Helicobacter canis]|uniref:Peptidyl-tRNA hydrolase n=1 Tax=Helicobacter canis TaxID=29419 RepID=A0A377J851_9HELI|nr:aminoacyl-tRNA hydrolase [Helicobacter canis]STO97973.1 peptidyl-tRNA hydrolase [Helicobacter canis]